MCVDIQYKCTPTYSIHIFYYCASSVQWNQIVGLYIRFGGRIMENDNIFLFLAQFI